MDPKVNAEPGLLPDTLLNGLLSRAMSIRRWKEVSKLHSSLHTSITSSDNACVTHFRRPTLAMQIFRSDMYSQSEHVIVTRSGHHDTWCL